MVCDPRRDCSKVIIDVLCNSIALCASGAIVERARCLLPTRCARFYAASGLHAQNRCLPVHAGFTLEQTGRLPVTALSMDVVFACLCCFVALCSACVSVPKFT